MGGGIFGSLNISAGLRESLDIQNGDSTLTFPFFYLAPHKS
jgi:hypothetical protein